MPVSLEVVKSKKPTKTTRDDKAKAASLKIIPARKIEPYFKFCLYARNKVGKTVFACSSGLKTLVIDFNERGHDSVRKLPNVDVYRVQRWEDVDPIYWYLKGSDHPYEVIVLDTVTMMANVGMKWVLKDDLDRDMSRDPLTPDKRSYLKLGEMMKDGIIKFRNLDKHIIFNAQERVSTEEDEEGNTTTIVHPELSPAPRSTLLSATNIIGRLYVREVEGKKGKKTMERRMLLGPHPKYIAGGRFSAELKRIERNPNLADFIERVFGNA